MDGSDGVGSYVELAREHLEDGHLNQALECAEKAIGIDASNADAWYVRAQCVGDVSERKASLIRARSLTDDPAVRAEIEGVLDSVYDMVEVRIDLSEMPLAAVNGPLVRLEVDGERVDLPPDSPTSLFLERGTHRFVATMWTGAALKAERVCDVEGPARIVVGYVTGLFWSRLTLTMADPRRHPRRRPGT